MGLDILKPVLIGLGFGLIAISGLIASGLFGQYYDKTKDDVTKANFNGKVNGKGLRDCCLAISVLGCLSAAAAIAAIVLSIFLEEQTLILIIVGGVAALISFGCIVAEGIYTKKAVDYNVDKEIFDYNGDHNDEKKYIKESIELLLEHGRELLLKDNENLNLVETKDVLAHLGKVINDQADPDDQRNFTYHHLWDYIEYDSDVYITHHFSDKDFVVLIQDDELIYAVPYSKAKSFPKTVPVATTSFCAESKVTPKQRVCWPRDIKEFYTDFECKMIKLKEIKTKKFYDLLKKVPGLVNIKYPTYLYESIVVGDYYPKTDYRVNKFPTMFHLINWDEIKEYRKMSYPPDYYFNYTDSDKSFKVTAAEYVKTSNDKMLENLEKDNISALIIPKNVDSIEDVAKECVNYYDEVNKDSKKEYDDQMCYFKEKKNKFPYGINDFIDDFYGNEETFNIKSLDLSSYASYKNYIQSHYYYWGEGKYYPGYNDYMEQEAKDEVKELPKQPDFYKSLYTTALIHLIVQCIGIAIGVTGVVLGLLLGGKSPVGFEP